NRIQDRQKRFIGGFNPWESSKEASENVAEALRLEDAREFTEETGREASERTRETAESARESTVETGREFNERTRETVAETARETAEKLRLERIREVAECAAKEATRTACLLPIKVGISMTQ
ncbi:unnamed protein product, partial [Owenia fusiformis]